MIREYRGFMRGLWTPWSVVFCMLNTLTQSVCQEIKLSRNPEDQFKVTPPPLHHVASPRHCHMVRGSWGCACNFVSAYTMSWATANGTVRVARGPWTPTALSMPPVSRPFNSLNEQARGDNCPCGLVSIHGSSMLVLGGASSSSSRSSTSISASEIPSR